MSSIQLQHIDKYYGSNHVLKDLNLTIDDGDFMTLLGPSGCGKTTTLRVISGLEKPQNGKMLLDGDTVIDCDQSYYLEPGKRGLNLVFQSYALWPHMTVFENVAFGLKIKKLKKEKINEMVGIALERMKISEYSERYPNELSGGQQQRVAMARAIAGEAKLLLLDEPLSNLDARLRIDMRAELKRMHREMGTTIIYVTHDQIEALTMSTKIALFSAGRLVQVAPPAQLYQNPVTLDAADFIGNPRINFLEGKAVLQNGKLKAQCCLGNYVFDGHDLAENASSTAFDCIFGLRPEQVNIQQESGDGTIEATVYADQPAGSETLVSLICGKDSILAKEIGTREYAHNQKVFLRIDPAKMNIYEKASGKLVKLSV